eukprot:759441-Hanusia_phi.AAC.3
MERAHGQKMHRKKRDSVRDVDRRSTLLGAGAGTGTGTGTGTGAEAGAEAGEGAGAGTGVFMPKGFVLYMDP